jgi:hypothetical protein
MKKSTTRKFLIRHVPCPPGSALATHEYAEAMKPADGMLAAHCNDRDFGTSRWQLGWKCYISFASRRKGPRGFLLQCTERWHWDVIGQWWQFQHDTSSDRTPLARMLPRVIGSPGLRSWFVCSSPGEYRVAGAVGKDGE